jgi:hypothetical protein
MRFCVNNFFFNTSTSVGCSRFFLLAPRAAAAAATAPPSPPDDPGMFLTDALTGAPETELGESVFF